MAVKELDFSQVELLGFGRDKKGGHAKFRAALTKTVINAMEWDDIPEFLNGTTPRGELHGSHMSLQSANGKLAEWKIEISIGKVHRFETIRRELENKRGKGTRTDLHFRVDFADETGCRYLEEYLMHAGDSKGTLTVRHNPKAEQTTMLPETNGGKDDKQPGLEIN